MSITSAVTHAVTINHRCRQTEGVESVTISVTCSDGVTLGQGSTQYKCRECGGSLNAHSKECAMRTSVSENNLDLSELDEKEREANSKIALLERR